MTATLLLVIGFGLGYLTGRHRPYEWFDSYAWGAGISGFRNSNHRTAWALAWLAMHPVKAARSWGHRNDPRHQSPEVILNPEFFTEKGAP